MPLNIEKIRQLRLKLGISQDEAASRTGLSSRQAWQRIEAGGQPNIGLQLLERVAKTLGCRAKDLLK